MSFLQEKQSRRYVRFLVIFIIVMFLFLFNQLAAWEGILVCDAGSGRKDGFFTSGAGGIAGSYFYCIEKYFCNRGRNPVFAEDWTYRNGVSVAFSFNQRNGRAVWRIHTVFNGRFGKCFAGCVHCFLQKREKLYQEAEAVIIRYTEGKFDSKLPGKKTGTIYQLFHGIDRLATVLKSRNETEHKTKEFLKKTISDISHQLKTPLAALTMYTEIIQNEPENTEVVREFSGKIMQSLERMEELIQSLLKVTRLDAGYIPFEKACYPVQEVIFRASQQFITRAEREGKEMVFRGNRNATCVCDLEWTGEAVGNLIKMHWIIQMPEGKLLWNGKSRQQCCGYRWQMTDREFPRKIFIIFLNVFTAAGSLRNGREWGWDCHCQRPLLRGRAARSLFRVKRVWERYLQFPPYKSVS